MSEFDPRKPNSRPSTPTDTIAWFEFLLDEHFLEKHLQKQNPDPCASSLIPIFLHQSDVAANIAKDILPAPTLPNSEDSTLPVCSSKRSQALRLLALKCAAHLMWNLNTLDNSVPIPMMFSVLQCLLDLTLPPQDDPNFSHVQLDFSTLSQQALFALLLYHRWCLRVVLKDSFPSKPTKVPSVQIPGLMDANVAAGAKEPIINTARNTVPDSLVVLERLLQQSREILMPTFHCFGSLTENTHTAKHDWKRGQVIPANDLKCQVCYDLGCLYFMKEDYTNAANMLSEASKALKKVSCEFVDIDRAELSGYSAACGLVQTQSLFTKVQIARQDAPQDIPGLLIQDNTASEMSLQYRLALEEELRKSPHKSPELLFQVECCNMVCRLQHNAIVPPAFLSQLEAGPQANIEFFAHVIKQCVSTGSFAQKANVKKFLWFVCLRFPGVAGLQEACRLALSTAECQALQQSLDQQSVKLITPDGKPHKGNPVDQMEQRLRFSCDPEEIKHLLQKLLKQRSVGQVKNLSEKWRLPRDLYMLIENECNGLDLRHIEKQSRGFDMLYMVILIGNAKHCIQKQQYGAARASLRAAEAWMADKSYALARLLQYELLHVDLVQWEVTAALPPHHDRHSLVTSVKQTATNMQHETGLHPPLELVASCSAFLLSMDEWDFMLNINSPSRYLQFGKILAAVCKELPNLGTARKPARALWDAMLHIFTNTHKQMRKGGQPNGGPRDQRDQQIQAILTQTDFYNFIKKVLEPVSLSVLISCITRLYNMLKDDIMSDISSDYIGLWPSALNSASGVNAEGVSEAMALIMDQALKYNPANPSWLRTQADIHIAHSQHSEALKLYLQSGMVTTDCFSDPVPDSVYSDEVYKRMIKCLSYLQCHTQVAVLCQFLKDIDYMTAFKALQERATNDASDAYHDCIWDVTLLEYIINLHAKRGEHEKQQEAIKLIGQPELNCSNPGEIQCEAAKYRKIRFLRAMAKQFT